MKKNYSCFFLIFICLNAFGKYSITSFASLDICSAYPSGYSVKSFSLNETSKNGLSGFTKSQTNTTLILGFSNAAFEFNPGIGTVTVTGNEVTIVSYTILASSVTVTITTGSANAELNVINFNNFEIRATSAATGYLRRSGGTFKIDNKTSKPPSTTSWGNITAGVPLAYSATTATQSATTSVFSGSTDNLIIGLPIAVTGTCSTLTATSFNFNTTGSTNASSDILTAKLYYTQTTNIFSTATLFGSSASPSGAFSISGSQLLDLGAGTYYFWLTYDLRTTATSSNVVDAQLVSSVISGNTHSPVSGNPTGSRTISTNVFYSIAAGNWSNNTTIWSLTSGGASCSCAPTGGNGFVYINHAVSLDNSYTVNNVTVLTGGNLTNAATRILTVTDNLSTSGTGVFAATTSWVLKDVNTAGTASLSSLASISLSGNLSIGSGTSLTMTGGALLTVNGNITVDGTLALGSSNLTNSNAAGTVINGTGTITGSGTITLGVNKSIPVATNLTIAPIISIPNNITITNNGTVNMQNNISGGGVNAQWTNAINSTLNMGGTTSDLLTTGKLESSSLPNTVSYTGSGNQNIKTPVSSTYHHLVVSSSGTGIKSLQAAIIVNGDVTISTGAQLNANASGNTINLYGNWTNNSTHATPFSPSTSTVFFNGSNDIISGTGISSFYTVNISSSGFLTANSSTGKITVTGNWVNEGDFAHNSSDITFDGTTTISGAINTTFNTIIVNSTKTLTLHATETDFDGNLTSNGTLNHNSGLVVFTGVGTTQNINGSASALTLYQVEISNPAGNISLSRPLTINNALTLTSGNITSDATNILTLIAGSTATSGSALSFVSGPLKKQGSTDFVFPLGKGIKWRRLAVTSLSATSDMTAEYFNASYSNTSVTSPLVDVSILEYWQVEKSAPAVTAKTTLYWEDASVSGITDCSDLTIGNFNTGTSLWQEYVGTASGTCTGTGTGAILMNTASNSFGLFTFASNSPSLNPLPVSWLLFEAECVNQKTILTWKTATETNSNYFLVEQSTFGKNWQTIDSVKGAGNSNRVLTYSVIVNKNIEKEYFRLKQIDFNGEFNYSPIIEESSCNDYQFDDAIIVPNPSSDNFEIHLDNNKDRIKSIEIYNIYGKRVGYSEGNLKLVDVSEFSNGIFFIKINLEFKTIEKRIMVKH